MLKKHKDFWRKKAQEDYLEAKNEEERQQAIQLNQAAWKKRVDESAWLLKNTPTDGVLTDQALTSKLEQNQRRKYIDMDLADNLKDKKKKKKKGGISAWRHNLISMLKLKKDDAEGGKSGKKFDHEDEEDASPRRGYEAEKKKKEDLAKKMRLEDEAEARQELLQTNVDRILVLERSVAYLKRPRMPKHHRPVTVRIV